MERNTFRATASHSPNDGFLYPFVEKRMEQIGILTREAQSLAQGVAEIYLNYGLTKLGKYSVFDLLVGDEGRSPLVEFTTKDGMNGWLFLPVGYGDKKIVEHEIRVINSLFKQLEERKVIILTSESSIPNVIFTTLGEKVSSTNLEDGSTGFYLKNGERI